MSDRSDGHVTTVATAPVRRRPRRSLVLVSVCGILVLLFDVWLLQQYLGDGSGVRTPPPGADAVLTVDGPSVADTVLTPSGPTAMPGRPARPMVAESWVSSVAARSDIPPRALTAYANAHLATNVSQPNCHLSWTMLAGIGAVESGHGSVGGATLLPDGTTSAPIVGPALDGTHQTVAMPATEEGRKLHGDPRWEHAIGPMQFLPSTWSRWAVSADGEVPNPNDIDDAALTAARYLCAAADDLATAQGWQAAIRAYNAPTEYAAQVTELANRYARQSLS